MALAQRRFSAEALMVKLGSESQTAFARTCHVERNQMRRYLRDGFPETTADRIATRVGMHPAEVWPDWYEAAS